MGTYQLTHQEGVTAAEAYNLPFAANYAAGLLQGDLANRFAKTRFFECDTVSVTSRYGRCLQYGTQ